MSFLFYTNDTCKRKLKPMQYIHLFDRYIYIYIKYFPPKWSFVTTYISSTYMYILKKVYMFEYKIFWSFKRKIFCSFQDRGIQKPILVNFPYHLISTPPPLFVLKLNFTNLIPDCSICVGFFLTFYTWFSSDTVKNVYSF